VSPCGAIADFQYARPVAYAENSDGEFFIQWYVVVICIWCPLFVMSQFDVMFMFPNQRFGEVFDIICNFFYTHSP